MEMEVVLGIGEEARPKACSSEIGSGEKTLEVDAAQGNGVRVSENAEQKVLVDAVDDEKAKENVVEAEVLNGSGVIEDCVMNGVSSLLKLSDVQEEDEEEEKHGYCVGDFVWGKIKNHPWWPGQIYDPSHASDLALKIKQKRKLLVAYFGDGTFAWCDPSQLKPFADSFKECSAASNSKSFLGAVEEAVEEMGTQIERLLLCDGSEEIHNFDTPQAKNAGIKEGLLVPDVRRELFSSLVVGKPEVILKDVKTSAETVTFSGLLDLEILKRKVSAFFRSKRGYGLIEYHEPQPVPGLEDKNKDDEDDNIDDGSEWRHGGAKRSTIEEEEENEQVEEEDEALGPEESIQRSLEKCSAFPDHRLQHRRKQKSIAEILENESAAKVNFETEPAGGVVKSSRKKVKRKGKAELENISTTTPRSRRMSELSMIEDTGDKKVKENGKNETSRKKKKLDVDDDDIDGIGDRGESAHGEEIEKNEVSDLEVDIDSTPLASLRKRVRVDGASVEKNPEDGQTTTLTHKRERKKSKYLSPDYLSDFSWKGRKKSKNESESSKVSSQSRVGGERMTGGSGGLVAAEEDKLDNGFSHDELSQQLNNAVEFLRLGATPEEMRDLIRVTALGTQYPEDSSSRDMVREFISIYRSFTYQEGANTKLLGSCNSSDKEKEELIETGKPETKGKERKDKKRKSGQQAEEIEQNGKAENEINKHETTKKERKSKMSESKKQVDGKEEEIPKMSTESTKKERMPKLKKQADEEEETLEGSSESTRKERKPKKPKSKQQADEEVETLKKFNVSTKKEREPKKARSKKQADEEEETLQESSETMKKERKLKKPESKKQASEEKELLKESSETRKNERKRKKGHGEDETPNETEKPEKKKKKKSEGQSKKPKMDEKEIETEKKFSGADLFVSYGPGSNLPKKEELIDIYEKFGALDEERTYMFYANHCARVAFLSIADGEKAFEASLEKCPFASTSTIKFRLKYPNESREEKKAGAEVEVAETTMEVEYVKKKLEEMRSLVDESEGGISEENKVKLEDEMVNLLEKVRKLRSS